MGLKAALSAIPQAAQNPFAFLAYIAALSAWVLIAARVRRNRNLLAHLDKLPPQDRLIALKSEMGEIPVPEGLSAKDWLKARNQRYYFLAFAMLCALAIIIFAIASFVPPIQANLTMKVKDPYEAEKRVLGELALGIQRPYVVSQLGIPQHETKYKTVTCSAYELHYYDIYFVYDNESDNVQFFSLLSKDNTFHPTIDTGRKPMCLGCLSFSDAMISDPVYFDYSSKFWVYAESYRIDNTSGEHKTLFLIERDGADYGGSGSVLKTSGPSFSDVLEKLQQADSDVEKFYKSLNVEEQQVFDQYRKTTRFNSFAWWGNFEIPDQEEKNTFELERGGHSSCPDQVVYE